MIDITNDDILHLDDTTLRELVAMLAKAELQQRGHSALYATWGGAQTTKDGGIDVRIDLPPGSTGCGPGVPRAKVGFQVKKPDMARAEIKKEMRPGDVLRPSIAKLAEEGGAYIIVSSTGSTSYTFLEERRQAIRDMLHDCPNAANMHTDFFDRTRMADWVREHPGVMLWLREKVGRALDGWHPYGAWSHRSEDAASPYLLDDRVRIRIVGQGNEGIDAATAISQLRKTLGQPSKAVRLVGLSGVGKTRFVQALFDHDTGTAPLPQAHAVYTDLNHNPSPQPVSMATNLVALQHNAVLIVDNCGTELHQELTKVCTQVGSRLSLITVEYDVYDDLPEQTEVVTIDTASPALIAQLIMRRHPGVSPVDATTIADAAEGNARIALAIAQTVGATEDLASMTQKELFDRLFWQRQQKDPALLRAAQACALVYSFHGELFDGPDAELPVLATLAGQSADDVYMHVRELMRRDLVQSRSDWRAVLPHALANHLAGLALDSIAPHRIRASLIDGGNIRLLRSFSHRLSYLHANPAAVKVCASWLEPGGRLSDVGALDGIGLEMLARVAPVVPDRVLAAFERIADMHPHAAAVHWRRHATLLRSIAYEADLFSRCVSLLLEVVKGQSAEAPAGEVRAILASFFQIAYSGTHASVASRMQLIETWLGSDCPAVQATGQAALQRALQTQLTSHYSYAFGARPRDYGYRPASTKEADDWYRGALTILGRLVADEGARTGFAKTLLAKSFEHLWQTPALRNELAALMRHCAKGEFWQDGWEAIRAASRLHSLDRDTASALRDLEADLAPADLASEVISVVLISKQVANRKPVAEKYQQYTERMEKASERLGERVAGRMDVLAQLAPRLLQARDRTEMFGRGLGRAVSSIDEAWVVLIAALTTTPAEKQNPSLLRGFLSEVSKKDMAGAQHVLDECLGGSAAAPSLPALQHAIGWDLAGVERLRSALKKGLVPISEYRYLHGAGSAPPEVQALAIELLLEVLQQPGGFKAALDVVSVWPGVFEHNPISDAPSILPVCRAILRHSDFGAAEEHADYILARLASIALVVSDGESIAEDMARALCASVTTDSFQSRDLPELLSAMFRYQTAGTLSGLYGSTEDEANAGIRLLRELHDHGLLPDTSLDTAQLLAWCSGDRSHREAYTLTLLPVLNQTLVAGRLTLTAHARALLETSSSPKDTLDLIVERLSPRAWSGSRAELMAHNLAVIDDVTSLFDAAYQAYARETKARLLSIVEIERNREIASHRSRDERFE